MSGDSRSLSTNGASSATHKGFVVTNTTELATEVYSNDRIQVAKCSARNNPASAASSNSRRESLRNSAL